ncbi:hypothetical protein EZV62_026112 [Acer yangbiense]|uniref:Reverse transcriptase Ty1/copia-type domain-containing protein n=1 Tax=Acer yangbiense TaxID=1000413 RepID=A0A5C7GQ92_9ROSI|nr:hypothetical protein EZV62_026112 [Acer yangbiense]
MDPSKGLVQNLDEFKKMTIELANADENKKLSDENEAIILLNSLPESFKDVKAAIKYGRSSLSLEECISTLKSKDLELKIERKDNGENLFARGRPLAKNNNQNYKNKCRRCCVSWKSQLQSVVALSTTEAEYIAETEAVKEAIWLQGLLNEINGRLQMDPEKSFDA